MSTSVVSVSELFEDRRTFEDAQQRRHTRSWHVLVDTVGSDSSYVAQTATGIPVVKPVPTPFSGDPFAVCRTVSCEPVSGNRKLFKVTAEYSTAIVGEVEGQGGSDSNPNPVSRPAQVIWSSELMPSFQRVDVNGLAFVNSARQSIDPPPQIVESILTLTVNRNEANYDPAIASDYIDTTNENEGTIGGLIMPVGCCWCVSIDGQRQYEAGYSYWAVTYQFKFKREYSVYDGRLPPADVDVPGWDVAELDQGYYTFDSTDGLKQIVDSDGEPIREPWLLDGAGGLLIPVDETGYADTTDPVYLVFQVKERRDFSVFDF